jgi:hypothetical protein
VLLRVAALCAQARLRDFVLLGLVLGLLMIMPPEISTMK